MQPSSTNHLRYSEGDWPSHSSTSLVSRNDTRRGEDIYSRIAVSHEEHQQGRGAKFPPHSYPSLNLQLSATDMKSRHSHDNDHADVVCSISAPPETAFACHLWSCAKGGKGTPIRCVVDSGAGAGYVVGPLSGALASLPQESCRLKVLVANGTEETVTSVIKAFMSLGSDRQAVRLFILPSPAAHPQSPAHILFGRSLMADFKVDIIGGRACVGGKPLQLLAESNSSWAGSRNESVRWLCEQASELVPPSAGGEFVEAILSTAEKVEWDGLLAGMVVEGWTPLKYTPGFAKRLRRLEVGEVADCPTQEFVFELKLPPITTSQRPSRSYAYEMMMRLDERQRQEYGRLINEYLEVKWWWPVASVPDNCPIAQVFGVSSVKKLLRLVSDFRPVNCYYPSSSPLGATSLSILALKLAGAKVVVMADAKSAFYKVRLHETVVYLQTGLGYYLSGRMCFGLSYGPAGLSQTLGRLFALWLEHTTAPCTAGLYVDDIFVSGDSVVEVEHNLTPLIYLMSKCGFQIPRSKYQLIAAATPDTDGSLLGVRLSYSREDGSLCMRCQRRYDDVRDLLSDDKLTKSTAFSAAGILSHDPVKAHGAQRLLSDCIRSVVGRLRVGWDDPLGTLQAFTPSEGVLFRALVDWCHELCNGECDHQFPTDDAVELNLIIQSDASSYGGAFVVKMAHGNSYVTLAEEVWCWKKSEYSYSVNRLELISLWRAVKFTTQAVLYYESTRTTSHRRSVKSVVFECDNSTCVAWVRNEYIPAARATCYEHRLLTRVLEGMLAELKELRCQWIVRHISGADNTDADRLSRLLYRPISKTATGKCIGEMMRDRYLQTLKRPRPNQQEEVQVSTVSVEPLEPQLSIDIAATHIATSGDYDANPRSFDDIRRIQDDFNPVSGSLVEQVAADCYDVEDLISRFGLYRSLIHFWRHGGSRRFSYESYEDSFAAVIHSAQLDADDSLVKRYGTPKGLVYTSPDAYGGETELPVIPYRACQVQKLFGLTYHRIHGHRSADFLLPLLPVFLEKGRRRLHRLFSQCLVCQQRNAKHLWTLPRCCYERDPSTPPYTRLCMDHLSLPGGTVLTVACLDSGHVSLLLVSDKTTMEVVHALVRLVHRYGVAPVKLYADNAACFTSPLLVQQLRRRGITVATEFSAAYSPFQNPAEVYNKLALSILRVKLRIYLKDVLSQDLLDEVSYMVNLRPLGSVQLCPTGSIYTSPQLLAFGWSGASPSKRLATEPLRRMFYDVVFKQLKHQSHRRNISDPIGGWYIGQHILSYRAASKTELCWRANRIRDIMGNRIRLDDGSITSGFNIVPLRLPFDPSPIDSPLIGRRINTWEHVYNSGISHHGVIEQDCREFGVIVSWDPEKDNENRSMTWSRELVDWDFVKSVDI